MTVGFLISFVEQSRRIEDKCTSLTESIFIYSLACVVMAALVVDERQRKAIEFVFTGKRSTEREKNPVRPTNCRKQSRFFDSI